MTMDERHHPLDTAVRTWLADTRLVPDVAAFLDHGYLPLCLQAWPDATGERLTLAARWAVWTWAVDDLLDSATLTSTEVQSFAREVSRAVSGGPLVGEIHPAVAALLPLATATRTLMPADWWRAYQSELIGWIVAVEHKLTDFVRPGRVPSLREYQALRRVDGGMVLAARWTELGTATVPAQPYATRFQTILRAFSAVGCSANDARAADDEVFSILAVLAQAEGLTIHQARERAITLLAVDWDRWEAACGALQSAAEERPAEPVLITSPLDVEVIVDTPRAVRGLDRFLRALLAWTETSSRYAVRPSARAEGVPR